MSFDPETSVPLPWREGIKPARHRKPACSGEAGGGRGNTPTLILPRRGGGDYGVLGWTVINSSGNGMRMQLLSVVLSNIDL
jgi:hypothetical protein